MFTSERLAQVTMIVAGALLLSTLSIRAGNGMAGAEPGQSWIAVPLGIAGTGVRGA